MFPDETSIVNRVKVSPRLEELNPMFQNPHNFNIPGRFLIYQANATFRNSKVKLFLFNDKLYLSAEIPSLTSYPPKLKIEKIFDIQDSYIYTSDAQSQQINFFFSSEEVPIHFLSLSDFNDAINFIQFQLHIKERPQDYSYLSTYNPNYQAPSIPNEGLSSMIDMRSNQNLAQPPSGFRPMEPEKPKYNTANCPTNQFGLGLGISGNKQGNTIGSVGQTKSVAVKLEPNVFDPTKPGYDPTVVSQFSLEVPSLDPKKLRLYMKMKFRCPRCEAMTEYEDEGFVENSVCGCGYELV